MQRRQIEVVVRLDPPAVIPRARLTCRASRQRDRLEAPVVKLHEMEADERRLRTQHRHPEKLLHDSIGRDDDEDVVVGGVEQKRRREQIGLAHVVVLILVRGAEEAIIRSRECSVVLRDRLTEVFAFRVLPDDRRRRLGSERSVIESRRIVRIEKSGSVA